MPSDDYAAVGGGALKLKGAKVHKKGTKKKNKAKSSLEQALSVHQASESRPDPNEKPNEKHDGVNDEARDVLEPPGVLKTESERRHDEARKKRLLDMTQATGLRPELLKTHKERVEELNTYLSKLSEHHDMPKIGPG
ncbi:hypothetical protein CDD82_5585 [Ophiocordyceps australis]|uniref:DUF1754-domain-containing protein n=1 Tax=Ophiocordyceps australis TaxID=1399860 RepID=A0A2C5ZKP1_9HYPO|nr:hypothetical protein CDD82_5585 [Ophiocordyceps australis]